MRILVLVMVCALLTGCGQVGEQSLLNGHGAKTYNVTVQGPIFGGNADNQIKTEVSFDPAWVTKKSNTDYNKDLAAFSSMMVSNIYFREKDLKAGTPNRVLFEDENVDEYDVTDFLKEVGFSEVQFIESFKDKEYEYDGNDSVTMLLSHGVVDNKYDFYAVVLRGCYSNSEWSSAYDPGFDGETYTELTGEHPEWIDREELKGISVSKERAMDFIDEFIEQNDNPNFENCILVTGHSRGGSLAGMIGAVLEDREDLKSYTYTFNAPAITTNEKSQEYRTVFNVFDSNDYFVNPLPFGEERLYRYGRDMTISIADSDEVKDAISKLGGSIDFTCMNNEELEKFEQLFGQRFRNRESAYDMKTIIETFDTQEEALNRVEELEQLIGSENGLGLEMFCSVDDVVTTADGKYDVVLNYCDAAILQAFARSLAYGTLAHETTVKLFGEDKQACDALAILMDNWDAVVGCHRLINSFVLTQYVD